MEGSKVIIIDSQSSSDDLFEEVKYFALNWYRDSTGADNTVFEGLSLGTTLSAMVRQVCSSVLGYEIQRSEAERTGQLIPIPVHSTRLQRGVLGHLVRVDENSISNQMVVVDEQKLSPDHIRVPLTAQVVRMIQRPLHFALKMNQTLYITDWTTANVSRQDRNGRVLYRRSLLRSAIPYAGKKDLTRAELMYPHNIKDIFSVDHVHQYLQSHDMRWSTAAIPLLVGHVQLTYVEIRKLLVRVTAQFLNMLDFYKPSKVILPADAFESFIIYYQLCRSHNVATQMYVDGYQVVPMWPVTRTIDNQDWLPERVAAFGSAQKEMIAKMGFPLERVDLIDPPLLTQEIRRDRRRFDAIVLTWFPRAENPSANRFSPADTLAQVLSVLDKVGFTRIGIKIRNKSELLYVSRIVLNSRINVDVLDGRLHDYLECAPLFIGGISSALAECVGSGKRYIVHEPYENGYTDKMISESRVVSRETISRSPEELQEMIHGGSTSWVGNPLINLRVL